METNSTPKANKEELRALPCLLLRMRMDLQVNSDLKTFSSDSNDR